MSSRKPGLTKRLARYYREILSGRADPDAWWLRGHYPPHYLNAMCAYSFAKRWQSRDIDLMALQRIVISGHNPEMAYLWARDIPGASIKRLQQVVLEHGNLAQLRKFARDIPGANAPLLEKLALVQEVMAL